MGGLSKTKVIVFILVTLSNTEFTLQTIFASPEQWCKYAEIFFLRSYTEGGALHGGALQ